MKSIKIFTDINQISRKYIHKLNFLCSLLWGMWSSEQYSELSEDWVNLFQYEPTISKADICLLPYLWNHYVNTDTIEIAQTAADKARTHSKPLVVFNSGDYAANLPFTGAVLFEAAGYFSRQGFWYHSGQPKFLDDYLRVYCNGKVNPRPKQDIPVISFCGQTNTSTTQTVYRYFRLKRQQWAFKRGIRKWEPPPFETSAFRSKVLRAFERKAGIKTNYILRSKYWAGKKQDRSLHTPVRLEFVNNILNSDYTLCMRGGGNYSARFYETLCLGRIPIYINTDCLLPFQDEIDYKSFFPWIEVKDLPHAAEIIREYHSALSPQDFIAAQKLCRWLWERHMTLMGFHSDFVKKINHINKSAHLVING